MIKFTANCAQFIIDRKLALLCTRCGWGADVFGTTGEMLLVWLRNWHGWMAQSCERDAKTLSCSCSVSPHFAR